MDLPNDVWTLVGDETPATLTVQNVGSTNIIYVFEAAAPGPDDLMARGDHFIVYPGSQPLSFGGLNTEGKSMYARSYSSRTGQLSVSSYVGS